MTKKSTSIQKNLGERMRELRKSRHLSQEDLALEAELDRTYISGIERGKRNVSIKNIGKIARALKVNPKELLP